jgi:hypothetical protein
MNIEPSSYDSVMTASIDDHIGKRTEDMAKQTH